MHHRERGNRFRSLTDLNCEVHIEENNLVQVKITANKNTLKTTEVNGRLYKIKSNHTK